MVSLGASIDDRLSMMGETSEMAAIFLRPKRLVLYAVASGVKLNGVIRASSDQQMTFVVKVEGCNICIGLGESEQLRWSDPPCLERCSMRSQYLGGPECANDVACLFRSFAVRGVCDWWRSRRGWRWRRWPLSHLCSARRSGSLQQDSVSMCALLRPQTSGTRGIGK